VGNRARAAALAFGAPVVWQHDEVPPGRTLSAAHARGIPSIYAETTGGTWLRAADIAIYVRGLFNLLRHLGMLEGSPEPGGDPILLRGGGNLDFGIATDASGYLRSAVELLDAVKPGDLLGTVYDVYGSPVQEIRTPHGGKVVMRRETPVVFIGDMVYALTSEERA
jgi:predicted deacylase